MVRFADDTIVGFEHEHEAQAFLRDLQERMSLFDLALLPVVAAPFGCADVEKSDHRHRRLLRPCHARPRRRRAAEEGDELASFHDRPTDPRY